MIQTSITRIKGADAILELEHDEHFKDLKVSILGDDVTYLLKAQAMELRDFLNKAYPKIQNP